MRSHYSSVLVLLLAVVAKASDPVAQMTLRVTDDFGNKVASAPVIASTFLRWVPDGELGRDEYDQAKGITDTNGMVTLVLPSKTGNMRYWVDAEGSYYDDMYKMKVGDAAFYRDMGGVITFTNYADGKWQPWNQIVEIQIKKVLNPIPMYARYLEGWSFKFPAYNTPLGYDLVKSDWIPPYGTGDIPDFIFKLDCQLGGIREDGIQLFDAILTLSFCNEGDGIQELTIPVQKGSVFKLPRNAPEVGYASNWMARTFANDDSDSCEYMEQQNFFYRIRTKKDEKGCIVSALYGKIQGPLFYEVRTLGTRMKWRYYLNPIPNNRNMEFDPDRNLLTDLPTAEQVKDP